MKNESASERAASLVNESIDMLHRAVTAPASPVSRFLTAKERREYRRAAVRLRKGQVQPRYGNLHSAEKLASIYERTAQRDEILEQTIQECQRIEREFECVYDEDAPAALEGVKTLILEAHQAALEEGPESEAALRFFQLSVVANLGFQQRTASRRQRAAAPPPRPSTHPSPDLAAEALYREIAAEFVESPPSPAEPVIAIPPEDSGRERLLIRIGVGDASWIGSFECGHKSISTVVMMPDEKHLFVSADGAGYILDRTSHALVERTGMEVVGTVRNESHTLLFVDHAGISLEAFGENGRLWKTGPIAFRKFRRLRVRGDELAGDARRIYWNEWTPFAVNLVTGEVRFE